LAYNEVRLHIPHGAHCKENCATGPHIHCYRVQCNIVLFAGETVAKFRNGGRAIVTKYNVAKYFCLPCGKLLTDSTVRDR
jgi:hypothetical protein